MGGGVMNTGPILGRQRAAEPGVGLWAVPPTFVGKRVQNAKMAIDL